MPSEDFICPNCGADVPAKARACPECGADEKTGWSANTIYDGTDIVDPDKDEFDYEDRQRREVEGKAPRNALSPLVRWTALLILIVCVLLFVVWQWCAIP